MQKTGRGTIPLPRSFGPGRRGAWRPWPPALRRITDGLTARGVTKEGLVTIESTVTRSETVTGCEQLSVLNSVTSTGLPLVAESGVCRRVALHISDPPRESQTVQLHEKLTRSMGGTEKRPARSQGGP